MNFKLLAAILTMSSAAQADGQMTSPDAWKTHVVEDLLPFWSDPFATGTPSGSFAGNLCNDGSAPVAGSACTGVSDSRANNPEQTLVGQSRQVFSYAIAFHMTGQQVYLDLAKAGTDYQFETFYDDDTGLFDEVHDVTTGATRATGGGRDSQQQAYGLLGPSFLYYLTADADLYDRIEPVEKAITDQFRLPETGAYTGAYKFRVADDGPADSIAKHLDQLNSYKTLLAAQAPNADRATLQEEARQTADYLKDAFFDPATGAMRPTLSTPSGSDRVDFGHSIKSFWFMDQTAQLVGDAELSRFAQDAAKALLKDSFQDDPGAWITDIRTDGKTNTRAHWWGFAELNQYAASLAIEDPELRDMLSRTQAYWFEKYVDPVDGGIWGVVDIDTGEPDKLYSKHWQWKAGFHSYEHALINYLSAGAIAGTDLDLFFARSDLEKLDPAYGFKADVTDITDISEPDASVIRRGSLSNLTYAAPTPVPLPASSWLLVIGLATLAAAGTGRRARITGLS